MCGQHTCLPSSVRCLKPVHFVQSEARRNCEVGEVSGRCFKRRLAWTGKAISISRMRLELLCICTESEDVANRVRRSCTIPGCDGHNPVAMNCSSNLPYSEQTTLFPVVMNLKVIVSP